MQTNSKKVLEALPTFDDYLNLIEEIKTISFEKMLTENAIREKEAETFKRVMTEPQFFVNQKAVSVSYYENCYKFTGIDGELVRMREHLAKMVALLEQKRSQVEVYNKMHEMYKTLVYQEKSLA